MSREAKRSILGGVAFAMGDRHIFRGRHWTQTILDEGADGLSTQGKGTHDLRAWVTGRILDEDRAQRVRWLFNEFQVWEE